MTKKILALALAGTTAFSVFGGLNVWAAYDDVYVAYTPTTIGFTSAGTHLGENTNSLTGTALVNAVALFNFDDTDQTIVTGTGTPIYLFDYVCNDADKVEAVKTAANTIVAAGTSATADQNEAFVTALKAAYTTTTFETNVTISTGATPDRANAIYDLGKIYDDTVKQYFTTSGGDKTARVTAAELKAVYDADDVDGFALDTLFNAIGDAVTAGTATVTSTALYLTQEYKRIIDGTNVADTTTIMDNYDELYAELSARVESDYSASNWRNFQRLLADAEDLAAEANTIAKWTKAYNKLIEARDVACEAGKYTELQDFLKSLYTTNKTTSIKADYTDSGTTDQVYKAVDYTDRSTRTGYTAAFTDAFIDVTIGSTLYKSAYTKAYEVWDKARKYNAKVPQTEIDTALADLEDAIASLDPTSTTPNYQVVRLEEAVERASAYVESDYNTASRKYKDFISAFEKAEDVLAKANPSASEITNSYQKLADACKALNDVRKTIPSATRKALNDALKEANVSIKEIADQSGAQYKALYDAIQIANDVLNDNWGSDDMSTTDTFKTKSTISDYEAATEGLSNAVKGFYQTQGWYKNSAGKWMYGEGDSYYTDGWNKIGASWYYFNADGTAKQNEWFKDTDGEWYWFTNNANAAYGWAKVNGEWYYFKGGCKMVTGWAKVNGGWYYMAPSGKMMTGWVKVNNKWYYLSKESNAYGKMLENTTTPDGYKVGPDGAMI